MSLHTAIGDHGEHKGSNLKTMYKQTKNDRQLTTAPGDLLPHEWRARGPIRRPLFTNIRNSVEIEFSEVRGSKAGRRNVLSTGRSLRHGPAPALFSNDRG